jgi:hypothetical protein
VAKNGGGARSGDNGLAFGRRKEKREWSSWAERPGGPECCRFGQAGRPRLREGEGGPRGGEGRWAGRGWPGPVGPNWGMNRKIDFGLFGY